MTVYRCEIYPTEYYKKIRSENHRAIEVEADSKEKAWKEFKKLIRISKYQGE